jgi:RNA polymerase sigma-70 factor (family 1)
MGDSNDIYQQFKESFSRLYAPLCRYALTLVKEPHISEDIVQESFLRVWEKRQDLVGTDGLRYYLYTAVRNNCLTFLEKQQKTATDTLTGHEAAEAPAEPAEQPATEVDYNTLFKNAVDQLPPRCREVFVLSRVSGLTYQQIGDTLGISVKTVENQMGKALKMLRNFIRQKQSYMGVPPLIVSFLTQIG